MKVSIIGEVKKDGIDDCGVIKEFTINDSTKWLKIQVGNCIVALSAGGDLNSIDIEASSKNKMLKDYNVALLYKNKASASKFGINVSTKKK